jgi:hypothetical protein
MNKNVNFGNSNILVRTQETFINLQFIKNNRLDDVIYKNKRHGSQRTVTMLTAIAIILITTAVASFEILPMSSFWKDAAKGGARTMLAISGRMIQKVNNVGHNNPKILYLNQQEEHVIGIINTGGGSGYMITCMQRRRNNSSFSSSTSTPSSADKNKLVHSSFRIEENVIRALAEAAEKRGDTISGLVNRTLKNYVTSEMYFEELGFILVSKDFLRRIFSSKIVSDQKHLEAFGMELGLTVAKEYVTYFFPEVNSHTIIQFLDIWFRRFQSCQHRVDGNRHSYSVNHDISMNFSIAMKSMLEQLIEPIVKNPVDFKELTPNAIVFSFEAA